MTAFTAPIDIINRALTKAGAQRIDTLTDDSPQASESVACYGKLRRAELRRNVWRFAIRKTAMRALATTTKALTFGTWAVGSTYAVGDVVLGSDGLIYQSLVAANIAHDPTSTTGYWNLYFGTETADAYSATLTYFAGEIVLSSAVYYISLVNSNLASTPPSANWLALTTQPTAVTVKFLYPIGAGPFSDSGSDNVFRLPYGYLCEAPQDPLSPAWARDWLYQSNYIVTADAGPVIYRFVADCSDVTQYDPLFCEGLACRLAVELAPRLTQDYGSRLKALVEEYKQFMSEARIRNAIETGPVSPEEDSWVTVKLQGCFSPYDYT